MKKILIFSLAYYPKHVGGAEVAIKEITDRCPSDKYEFHVVTNRYDVTLPKMERVGNLLVHRIGIATKNPEMGDLRAFPLMLNKPLFQFLAAWKAARLHRQYRYDGVWAMMAHSCGVPAVLFKTRCPSVPFLLTLQEGDPVDYIEKKMRPLWPLFKRAFTKADGIQVISAFLENWARNRGATCPVEVIPNGVDIAHFTHEYSEEILQDVRKSVGKNSGEVWLVTTSRLVKKNAVDDVIRALVHLPECVHFLVYGTGPDEMPLKKLAHELGVARRVHWGGFLQHTDMPKYLKACDVFIRPSRSEGMGNSFVEAMAAGVPVIATQEGGIADFLFDAKRNPGKGTTGWAVDKDSPEQIAVAVQNIIDHPAHVQKVVAQAKEMVVGTYDWGVIAKNMRERVFDRVFAGEGA